MWIRFLPIKFPHVWKQIDIAVSTSLATAPSFAATPDYDNVPASIFIEMGTWSAQMETEPMLMTANSQDYMMSNEGGYAALIFAATSLRIALRYRLSFDIGSTYEECFWGEVDFASIMRTKHQTNVSGVFDYEFTVFDKVKTQLERETSSNYLVGTYSSQETITTLYNQAGANISSILPGTCAVVSVEELLDKMKTGLGLANLIWQTPFNCTFGIGTFNLFSAYILRTYNGVMAGYFYDFSRELKTMKENRMARGSAYQFASSKEVLRSICYSFGVYPQTYWGGSSGWAGTLEVIARTFASALTFSASTKYLSEVSLPHASKPMIWRATAVGLSDERTGGLGDKELSIDCYFQTLVNIPVVINYYDWFNQNKGQMLYFRSAANTYYIPNRLIVNMPNGANVNCESTSTYPDGSSYGLAASMGIHYAGHGATDAAKYGTATSNYGIWGKEREVLKVEVNTIRDSSGSFSELRPNREFVYDGTTYWITGVEKDITKNQTQLTLLNMS